MSLLKWALQGPAPSICRNKKPILGKTMDDGKKRKLKRGDHIGSWQEVIRIIGALVQLK